MDRDLVAYAMSLPPHVLLYRSRTKALLRAFLEHTMGGAVARRPKAGFTLPVHRWFAGPLRRQVDDTLASLKSRGLINPHSIDAVWNAFLRGQASREAVWQLLSIEYWFRNFLDADIRAESARR